jgi:hypothetical protein
MVTHGWTMMKDTIRLRQSLRKAKKLARAAITHPTAAGGGAISSTARPL